MMGAALFFPRAKYILDFGFTDQDWWSWSVTTSSSSHEEWYHFEEEASNVDAIVYGSENGQ